MIGKCLMIKNNRNKKSAIRHDVGYKYDEYRKERNSISKGFRDMRKNMIYRKRHPETTDFQDGRYLENDQDDQYSEGWDG